MYKIEELKKYEADIIKWRREIHMNPETGFEEFKTTELIIKLLKDWNIEVEKNLGETGVVGILKGKNPGETIALRADIDALNMQEESDCEYKSKVDGKMHACGHDAHTAMLLGAAKILSENRAELKGTVKFIFQPAEEGPSPGGGKLVKDSGILEDVDKCFAIHVSPNHETGKIVIKESEFMALSDFFYIDIFGIGTHGASPNYGKDPIIMATQVISAYQNIISREIDPVTPAVISVCTINGGSATNVIPSKVELSGTVRCFDKNVSEFIIRRMNDVLESITKLNGTSFNFKHVQGFPALINNKEIINKIIALTKELFGDENIIYLEKPMLGTEDFSYYTQTCPGAMIMLGVGNEEKGVTYAAHHPKFDIDESALINGTSLFVKFVLDND